MRRPRKDTTRIVTITVPKSLHKRALSESRKADMSLSGWICRTLASRIDEIELATTGQQEGQPNA